MSMVVKNNLEAVRTLNVLNQNSSLLQQSLERVSRGQKINSAKDDASAYAISEKMREQIRTLTQGNQNVQNGSSLLKIAEAGVSNIVEELRNLKELAINAANDTNTDRDRATIQKEFTQKVENINDIATTTNYNKITLLDGTWSRKIIDGFTTPEVPAPNYTSQKKNVSEPTGTPTIINNNVYNITADGVYDLVTGAGAVTISAGVRNVKFTQSGEGTLAGVSITGSSDGNANIWIDSLNISNNANNVFKFQGSGNVLTVKGTNTLTESSSTMAAINVGGGLNVQGDGTHSLTVKTTSGYGAAIGSNQGENSTGYINLYNLTLSDAYAHNGAVIGAGGSGGSVGKITIENSTIDAKGHFNAIIGSGNKNSTCGDVWIVNSSLTAGKVDGDVGLVDTGIGSGYSGSVCGDIYILDSTVEVHNQLSAVIGAGDAAKCGDIFVSASTVKGQSDVGACIGSGQGGSTTGDITITNASAISHKSSDGAVIGSGATGKVGKITVTKTSIDLMDASAAYTDETHKYAGIGRGKNGDAGSTEVDLLEIPLYRSNPLKIHGGTKANQATGFCIEDMHTKSLGTGDLIDYDGTFIKESDKERYIALGLSSESTYQTDLQAQWLATVTAAENKTLDKIDVKTKQNANVAIRVLDGAIDYALDEATNLGAALQRLDYTYSNIATMSENIQSSESTIRDSDMAKEMITYTKNGLLLQTAQSMLAQANQNSSAVLSLLQ